MKYPAILSMLILCFLGSYSQAQTINLSTQAEVDAWDQSITVIPAGMNVIVRESSYGEITNIDALSVLTAISGTLTIRFNSALTNIDGLSGLTAISGSLTIGGNGALTNINGLSRLTAISGSLVFDYNSALTNIDGLSGLTAISGSLYIWSNAALTNIDALSGLTDISGSLSIRANGGVTNIDGLSGLTDISGSLDIWSNAAITNIDGLSHLSSVSGSITIRYNYVLVDCCGISHLLPEYSDRITLYSNPSPCSFFQEIEEECGTIKIGKYPPCIDWDNGALGVRVLGYDSIPFSWELYDNINMTTRAGGSEDNQFLIEDLTAGNYSITVTTPFPGEEYRRDSIILEEIEGSVFEVTKITSTNSVNGMANGQMLVKYEGGNPPYDINWSGPVTGSKLNLNAQECLIPDLQPGDYSISIYDSDGAEKQIDITLLDEVIPVGICDKPLDVLVLNQISSGIDAKLYSESKDFYVNILESFNVGTRSSEDHAAVVEWGSGITERIPLTGDMSVLKNYTKTDRYFDHSFNPYGAIEQGGEYLLTNGRPEAQKVIIIPVLGCFGSAFINAAEKVKQKGITIVTVAVGYSYKNPGYKNILEKSATSKALALSGLTYPNIEESIELEAFATVVCSANGGSSKKTSFDRDGAINIDNIVVQGNCPNPNYVDVTFTVEALRELALPAGTPITFYQNNPLRNGGYPILTWKLPCALLAGESETFTLELPITDISSLYVLLNDDGEHLPALSFPITDISEVNYENNIDQAYICNNTNAAVIKANVYAHNIIPGCESIVTYTVDICNISDVDSDYFYWEAIMPTGFNLIQMLPLYSECTNPNEQDPSMTGETGATVSIPAGCCKSYLLYFDASYADHGYYDETIVELAQIAGSGQILIGFDGKNTTQDDVRIDGTIDCDSKVVNFSKEVNMSEVCEDHSLTYTFTIENLTNESLRGLYFRDELPDPLIWVYRPYNENGVRISTSNISDGSATFYIDEVAANTKATFQIDATTGNLTSNFEAKNVAYLDNVPDYDNGGTKTLTSNEVSTFTIADYDITSPDTIYYSASRDTVDLSVITGADAIIEWTTSGEGFFTDASNPNTQYILDGYDKIDTLISIFVTTKKQCEPKGKSIYLKPICDLSVESIEKLKFCPGDKDNDQAVITWTGGRGSYGISGDIDQEDITSPHSLRGLDEGIYQFALKDALGCIQDIEVNVNAFQLADIDYQIEDPECGGSMGSAKIKLTGGTPPYEITGDVTASGINDEADLGNLDIGVYEGAVIDNNGCKQDLNFAIEEKPLPQYSYNTECLTEDSYVLIIDCNEAYSVINSQGLDMENIDDKHYKVNGILTSSTMKITIINDDNGCMVEVPIEAPDCTCDAISIVGEEQFLSCIVDEVVLDGSASSQGDRYRYQWLDENKNILSEDQLYTASEAGLYTFNVTNIDEDCMKSSTVLVTDISNEPTAEIIEEEGLIIDCARTSVSLKAKESEVNTVYEWVNTDGNTSPESTIVVNKAGRVILNVIDSLTGCYTSDTVMVEDIGEYPDLIIAQDGVITCIQSEVMLSPQYDQGNENLSIIWYDEDGRLLTDEEDNLTATNQGAYIIHLINAENQCISKDTVNIVEDKLSPEVEVVSEAMIDCIENEVVITSEYINSSGSLSYQWSDASGETISEESYITIDEPGNYSLTATDSKNGCQAVSEVTVTEPVYIEEVSLMTTDPDCIDPNSGQVSVSVDQGGTDPIRYYINDEEDENGVFESLSAGEYVFSVIDDAGCRYDTLIVLDDPVTFALEGPSEITVNYNQDVKVNIMTDLDYQDIDTVIWSPNIDCKDCLNVTISSIIEDIDYVVTIKDVYGCSEEIIVSIRVIKDYFVDIPNVLRIDSDVNGVFKLQSNNKDIFINEMLIYDRWGNKMFEQKNIGLKETPNGWNGKCFGQNVLSGVYTYKIKYTLDGRESTLYGDVTVIR